MNTATGWAGQVARHQWIRILTTAFALALGISGLVLGSAGPAHATGDYGPDTCLQGWVWREANPKDHVCVTGATRSQTATDNAQAAAHRNPGGGPYGPDTCRQGWVWREAYSGDHVCVTGTTRSQAAADNAQAAARRDSLRLLISMYTAQPHCSGNVCTGTSTDSIPRFRLTGDHVNVGTVQVELRRSSGNGLVRGWRVQARPTSAPGGRFSLNTDVFNCKKANDSYFRIKDPSSGRWSQALPVSANCHVL